MENLKFENPFNESSDSSSYSNRFFDRSTVSGDTIKIKLSDASQTSNVITVLFSEKNKTSTSTKIDSEAQNYFIHKLKSYLELDEGWDGYRATKPSERTIDEAIFLIKKIPEDALPERVGLSNDGEISMIWDKHHLFADIGVIGEGTYSYFIQNEKDKMYGDDIKLEEKIPAEIIQKLRQ